MSVNRKPRSKRLHAKKLRDSGKKLSDQKELTGLSLGKAIDAVVPRFRMFYESSGLVLDQPHEWNKLIRSLRSPLPITFRLRHSRGNLPLSDLIQSLGVASAYQINADPKSLKIDHPDIHSWLIEESRKGTISRQELVSMIPVTVLGIKRNHRVLDMCSSPGSKTSQASDIAVDGVVVANELSRSRSHTLANRAAAPNVVVTCHKAQTFPDSLGKFDRIICDVPCSGDGAIRKYVDKWTHWEPTLGRQLHALQLQIALRAARLLRVNGQMSYSTCSLNPLENEAVIAALLKATSGALELVDKNLHAMHISQGLNRWKVIDEDLDEVKSVGSNRYRKTMFCQDEEYTGLEKCMRLYPHNNDAGGFFVAVLKKVRDWPSSDSRGCNLSFRKEYRRFESTQDKGGLRVSRSVASSYRVNQATSEFVTAEAARFINIISVGTSSN